MLQPSLPYTQTPRINICSCACLYAYLCACIPLYTSTYIFVHACLYAFVFEMNFGLSTRHSLPERVQKVKCRAVIIDFAQVISIDSSAFSSLDAVHPDWEWCKAIPCPAPKTLVQAAREQHGIIILQSISLSTWISRMKSQYESTCSILFLSL